MDFVKGVKFVAVTYTNRKGRKYYLHKGVTKTGKPRYYFSRDESGPLVDEIPEGYEISESVKGIVSLAKQRPKKILPAELQITEAALKRYKKSSDYRVNVRADEIQIYERVGPNPAELFARLSPEFFDPDIEKRLEEEERIYSQFAPILRFILRDEEERIFSVKRMCYLGSVDDWIDIGYAGSLSELVEKIIPRLGTERYFGLY
jgi:hypothetical protein